MGRSRWNNKIVPPRSLKNETLSIKEFLESGQVEKPLLQHIAGNKGILIRGFSYGAFSEENDAHQRV